MKRSLFFLLLLSLVSASEIINPEEDIPAYLHIKPFKLSVNPIGQGSASSDVTEAWLRVNGEFLGAYALPATVPILASGSTEITLSGGIRENGVKALPDIYQAYQPFKRTIELSPNETDTIQPSLFYQSSLKFLLEPQEGFESSIIQLGEDLDNNPATNLVKTTSDIFEGTASGYIHLTEDEPSIEVGSRRFENAPLPVGGKVYMELDYKTDVTVVFGIIGYDSNGNRIFSFFDKGVNPKDSWNKIYFNFTEEVVSFSNTQDAAFYQFCLHSQLNTDEEEGNIYIDNLKWITF